MRTAQLSDGHVISYEVYGSGPALLLPVNPTPLTGELAEQMRAYGTDPALGRSLIEGLQDQFQLICFDYEGQTLGHPRPTTLTPESIALDMLAVADAAGVERFAYYGYSWLALSGLQLALRTDRLSALIMGGFPPLHGPYGEMLQVTSATHAMAVANEAGEPMQSDDQWGTITLNTDQTRQFLTLYEQLQNFDDQTIQARLNMPRLCFAGGSDTIVYGKIWGDVTVDIVGCLRSAQEALTASGWQVRFLENLDHTGAMQAGAVLPVIKPWLIEHLH